MSLAVFLGPGAEPCSVTTDENVASHGTWAVVCQETHGMFGCLQTCFPQVSRKVQPGAEGEHRARAGLLPAFPPDLRPQCPCPARHLGSPS